jgi:hypothetical protein
LNPFERRRMRKLKWMGVLALAALLGLTACAGGGGGSPTANIDPAGVDGTLATEPDVVKSGEQVKLIVALSGLPFSEDTRVELEIRYNADGAVGEVDRLTASREGEKAFTATHTFPEAGTYHVYLHIYHLDLHITKLKKIEVT